MKSIKRILLLLLSNTFLFEPLLTASSTEISCGASLPGRGSGEIGLVNFGMDSSARSLPKEAMEAIALQKKRFLDACGKGSCPLFCSNEQSPIPKDVLTDQKHCRQGDKDACKRFAITIEQKTREVFSGTENTCYFAGGLPCFFRICADQAKLLIERNWLQLPYEFTSSEKCEKFLIETGSMVKGLKFLEFACLSSSDSACRVLKHTQQNFSADKDIDKQDYLTKLDQKFVSNFGTVSEIAEHWLIQCAQKDLKKGVPCDIPAHPSIPPQHLYISESKIAAWNLVYDWFEKQCTEGTKLVDCSKLKGYKKYRTP